MIKIKINRKTIKIDHATEVAIRQISGGVCTTSSLAVGKGKHVSYKFNQHLLEELGGMVTYADTARAYPSQFPLKVHKFIAKHPRTRQVAYDVRGKLSRVVAKIDQERLLKGKKA